MPETQKRRPRVTDGASEDGSLQCESEHKSPKTHAQAPRQTSTQRLRSNIAAGLLAEKPKPATDVQTCMACGRPFARAGRFCHDRCREAFNNGITFDPGRVARTLERFYGMQAGPSGFYINCAGCGREFESRGLRCCSTDCERNFRQPREEPATLQLPAKLCAECGGRIPRFRKGRRVSAATRFCSEKCRGRHSSQNRKSDTETHFQGPFYGPSRQGEKAPSDFAAAPLNLIGGGQRQLPGAGPIDPDLRRAILDIEAPR